MCLPRDAALCHFLSFFSYRFHPWATSRTFASRALRRFVFFLFLVIVQFFFQASAFRYGFCVNRQCNEMQVVGILQHAICTPKTSPDFHLHCREDRVHGYGVRRRWWKKTGKKNVDVSVFFAPMRSRLECSKLCCVGLPRSRLRKKDLLMERNRGRNRDSNAEQ